jgi:hypothetical protein
MVPRHKKIVDAVIEAGPEGIERKEFEKQFFKPNRSPTTVRTTLNRLNSKIKPLKFSTRNGRVRIV